MARNSPYKRTTRYGEYQAKSNDEIKAKLEEAMTEIRFMRGAHTDLKHLVECQGTEIEQLKEDNNNKERKILNLEEKVRQLTHKKETVDRDTNLETPEARAAVSAQDDRIQTLLKTNEDLQKEVKSLSETVKENGKIQEQIMAANDNIGVELGNTVRRSDFGVHLSNHARRVEEIANMDREIIAFGVEEKDEKDFNVRKTNERDMVTKILKAIDQEWGEQGLIEHRRMGKFTPEGKPRPLKITLGTKQLATNFIQKAKALKEHTQLKEIGIRQSLCKSDRETLKASVQEMKRCNNERTAEERETFFWSIRNLKATKIMKRQTQTGTGTEENRQ